MTYEAPDKTIDEADPSEAGFENQDEWLDELGEVIESATQLIDIAEEIRDETQKLKRGGITLREYGERMDKLEEKYPKAVENFLEL